jgi:hypothetical protein
MRLRGDPRFEALQRRSSSPRSATSPGSPRHGSCARGPDSLLVTASPTPHLHRGSITRQGSRLLRWAAVEAISGAHCEPRLRAVKNRVGQRRGRNIGRVAAARHLLTLVFYALRDGEIRCLATDAA